MAKEQAGTVYVQVLPGFEGWHDRVQTGLNKALSDVKADLEVTPKVDKKAAERELKKAGGVEIPVTPKVNVEETKKQAKKVAGAFVDEFRSRMASGLRSLPKVKLGSDATDVDRTMARIRKDMKALSKVKIGATMSGEQVMAQVARLRAALDKLNGQKVNVRARVDIEAAHAALESFEASVAKAGQRSGGAFAAEFTRGFRSSVEALPDFKITGDSSPLQRELVRIRTEALALSKLQVGFDIDEPTLKRKLDALRASAVKLNREASTLGESFDSNVVIGELDKLTEHWQHTGKAAHDVLDKIKADMAGVVGRRINLDITSGQAHAEIAGLDAALDTLERKSTSVDIKSNAGTLRRELKLITAQIEHLDEQDATVEVEVKVKKTGAFGNLLAKTFAGGEAALPEIELNVNSTKADRKLAALRSEIVALQDVELHAELDDAALLVELDRLMAIAKEVDRTAITVQAKMDASQYYRVLAGMRAAMVATGVQAHQTVRDINAELASIESNRRSLKISNAEALVQIAALKSRLDALARDTTSVSVEADVLAAHAALAGVEAHIKHVDGQTAHVKVKTDTDGGGGKGLGLPQLSLRLKAIISLATAGAGAIGGLGAAVLALGAAAVVGGASLAAVVVGVANITEAMKAQDAASKQAGQTAAQEAAQRLSATHQLLGAQESLADAQLQVANTARRSSANVRAAVADQARAERDLSDAQRDALRAQEDLNAARDESARSLEDQQNRVRDDALAQRQAVLDVKDAEAELARVRADPAATERQRVDAQLTYDQAVQRLAEVSLSYKRSQADAAKMAKAGVEGSAQVVSASEALVAAQRRIGDAQAAATDAAQRTSEARIDAAQAGADAAQQVIAAQRQLAGAESAVAVQAGQAGAAQEKMGEAFAKLSPEALRLVGYLKSQSGEWLLLQQASQQFAPGAQRALQTLAPHFGNLNDNVAILSRSFGSFLETVADGLVDLEPTFDLIAVSSTELFPRFGTSLSRAGGAVGVLVRDMLPLADEAFDVADGVSELVRSLSPFIASASGPLLEALGTFIDNLKVLGPLVDGLARPAQTLTDSLGTGLSRGIQNLLDGGLEPFLQAIADIVATLAPLIEHAGTLAGLFAAGLTPALATFNMVLAPVVDVLGVFVRLIEAIPGPFVAIVAGMIAIQRLTPLFGKAVSGMTTAITGVGVGAINASTGLGMSEKATGKVSTAFSRVADGMGKLGNALPVIGAGFVIFGAIMQHQQEQMDAADRQMHTLAGSLLRGGDAAKEAGRQMADLPKPNFNPFIEGVKHVPILGNVVKTFTTEYRHSASEVEAESRKMRDSMSEVEFALGQADEAQRNYDKAVRDHGETSKEATLAHEIMISKLGRVKAAQLAAGEATKTTTQRLQEQQDAILAMGDAQASFEAAGLSLQQAGLRIEESKAQAAQATEDATAAQKEYDKAVAEHGKKSPEATEAGKKLADANRAVKSATLGATSAQQELASAQSRYVASAKTAGDAAAKVNGEVNAGTTAMTYQNDALIKLLTTYGTNLPPAMLDAIAHMDPAIQKAYGLKSSINDVGTAILTLPDGKTITFQSNIDTVAEKIITNIEKIRLAGEKLVKQDGIFGSAWGVMLGNLAGALGAANKSAPAKKARGGFVGGRGTGDTVPALLTPGEFVFSRPAVANLGASNVAALHSSATHFAAGGLVGPARFATGGAVSTSSVTTTSSGGSDGVIDPATLGEVATGLVEITDAAPAMEAAITQAVLPALVALTATNSRLAAGAARDWWAVSVAVRDSTLLITNLYLPALRLGLSSVEAATIRLAGVTATQWQAIRASVADPVRWMLVYPYNALIGAWNVINTNFAVGRPIAPVVPGFAAGGPVPADVGTPGKDSVPALLMPGEFVAPVPMVRQIGMDNLEAARRSVLRGGSAEGVIPGYEAGGAVTKALSFAASQVGKPYIWGGVGPDGYDCSGLMSAVANVALGVPPHARRFTTAAFAPGHGAGGFVPGTNSTFVIGVSGAHMAGNLAGHNLESTTKNGRSGVRMDGDASGPMNAQFTKGMFYLPQVGGEFIPSAGGTPFDVNAMLDAAFAPTRAAIDALVPAFGPGTMAAGASAAMVQMLSTVSDWAKTNLAADTTPSGGGTGPVADQVRAVAARYGWGDGPQWSALSELIGHESGWRPSAQNPNSSAYGLFQFLTSTWASTGIGRTSDPTLQTEAGLRYVRNRYTDPVGAWNFWQGHHWYDEGGYLPPGLSLAYNGTGRPEPVLPAQQFAGLVNSTRGGDGSFTGNLYLDSGELLGLVRGQIAAADEATGLAINRRARI